MFEREEALRKRMEALPTEELIRMVREEVDQYEEDAIYLAKAELQRRTGSEDGLTGADAEKRERTRPAGEEGILRDLLDKVDFEELQRALLRYYPEEEAKMERYEAVYEKLQSLEPSPENADYINVGFEGRKIMVLGQEAETGDFFSPELCRWSDWLSFKIKDEQVESIGYADFLSHCMKKMTVYGFDERRIERKLRQIEENIELNEEEDEDFELPPEEEQTGRIQDI